MEVRPDMKHHDRRDGDDSEQSAAAVHDTYVLICNNL